MLMPQAKDLRELRVIVKEPGSKLKVCHFLCLCGCALLRFSTIEKTTVAMLGGIRMIDCLHGLATVNT